MRAVFQCCGSGLWVKWLQVLRIHVCMYCGVRLIMYKLVLSEPPFLVGLEWLMICWKSSGVMVIFSELSFNLIVGVCLRVFWRVR